MEGKIFARKCGTVRKRHRVGVRVSEVRCTTVRSRDRAELLGHGVVVSLESVIAYAPERENARSQT